MEAGLADALVACIRRCYGDTHPETGFDDPTVIEDLVERIQPFLERFY